MERSSRNLKVFRCLHHAIQDVKISTDRHADHYLYTHGQQLRKRYRDAILGQVCDQDVIALHRRLLHASLHS